MKLKSILIFSVVSLFLISCGSSKKTVKTTKPAVVIVEPVPEKLPSVKTNSTRK